MAAIFESLSHPSWWLLAALGGGGVVAFFFGNARLDKKLKVIGIALVLLAGLVAVGRILFPTDREKVEHRTRQLIKSVEQKDWNTLGSTLSEDTSIAKPSSTIVAGRTNIVNLTKEDVERLGLKSITIIGLDSDQTQTLITVRVEVLTAQDFAQGRPISSSWQFDYEQSGDDWILDKITLLGVGQESGDQVFNPFSN